MWLEDIEDTELAELYEMSKYLIFPSIDEGFGLPLVEAAQHKLPAIASDIPVFREIAGDGARYFEAANPDELAREIISACEQPKMITNIERISWAASINELVDKISNNS
jgi:alpha-1,2-rhamnosyltransferase